MQKVTALLPMKGHSERVPSKNLREMLGKPLFFHVASVLQASDHVENFIINTDSERIAELATANFSKVIIHWRPEAIRGDMVPMNTIIANDMSRHPGEHFLQTHSTNPMLTRETLDKAIQEYFASLPRHDSLFSVNKLQTRLYWESGQPVNHNPKELLRTQDLPPLFEENSNIFIFSRQSFAIADNRRIGLKPKMFAMDKLEAVDIDEPHDFIIAEQLLRLRTSGQLAR